MLSGKAALITGGASGLGKEFCRELLKQGAIVCVVDIMDVGEETARNFCDDFGQESSFFLQCDVADTSALERVFNEAYKRMGGLDIVCNNAGIGNIGLEGAKAVIDINLTAVVEGTRLALELMTKQSGNGDCCIVNVASMGAFVIMPFSPIYAGTKAGVVHFSRSVQHMTPEHIRVNALCPGFADTALVRNGADASAAMDYAVQSQGGLLSPEDVAKGFLKLVCDTSLRGQALTVTPKRGLALNNARQLQLAKL